MDYLTSLRLFVRACEQPNFSAVAKEFGLSGTMVGKHIRALEERLGGKLIRRTTRRQGLTDLGRLFGERARAILAEVAAADALAGDLQGLPRGLLRVSAPAALGTEALVPVICDYMREYPDMEVELSVNDRVVDLVDEGFHVAIRTGEVDDQNVIARPLSPYRVIACASPAYLARHGEPRDPLDLLEHHCLNFVHWGPKAAWRFRRGGETVSVPVNGRFRSNNVLALRRAAISGLGVVVQAEAFVAEAIAAGQLRRILPEWELRARPTHIVWLEQSRSSAKLRSFVEFVTGRLGAVAAMGAQPSRRESEPQVAAQSR